MKAYLVLVIVSLIHENGLAFLHPVSKMANFNAQRQQNKLQMVGNFISGITGQPPTSLDPPLALLANTSIDPNKSNVDLACVYKASVDGFSAVDFHRNCDGRGSGLVVILTSSGKKFGGFNPLGWDSTDDYGNSNSAFLWFEKNGERVRCDVLTGGNAAIFDYGTGLCIVYLWIYPVVSYHIVSSL